MEAAGLAHVGALIGVRARVFGEGRALRGGVGAPVTLIPLVEGVPPDHVRLELVVCQGGESALGAAEGLGEGLPIRVALVFGCQVLDEVEFLGVHHGTPTTLMHGLLAAVVLEVRSDGGAGLEALGTDGTDAALLGDVRGRVLHQGTLEGAAEGAKLALGQGPNLVFFPEVQGDLVQGAEAPGALGATVRRDL